MAARGQTLAAVAAKLEEADGCGGHEDELVDTKAFLTAAPLGHAVLLLLTAPGGPDKLGS